MIQFTGEKMAKSVGNIAPLHEVLDAPRPRRASSCTSCSGHYRQPLAFSEDELEDADAPRAAHPRRAAAAGRRRARARRTWPRHSDAFFDALANDFNTPTALAALFEWVREANRRGARRRRRRPARDARRARARRADAAATRPATRPRSTRRRASCSSSASRRARERDFASGRPHPRASCAALGWEIRDGPAGPRAGPAAPGRDRLRAQPRPRGAARPARGERAARSGRRARAAREPWLRSAPSRGSSAPRSSSAAAARSAHQGICADAGPYPYAAADELLAAPSR